MKTSSRPREIGGSFASRRGHAPQLSISDTNHHVTEAIGDMYGDDDYSKRDSRPLSFVTSPLHDSIESSAFVTSPLHESAEAGNTYLDGNNSPRIRPSPHTNGNSGGKAHTSPAMLQSPRNASFNKGELSPSLSLRERSGADANSQFPLSNIDYESDPAAVAQELSNLQALRRMSMDVGTSDPDLPSFQSSLMPSVAPTGDDDEDDPSRLFWVPARVHPELAPMEFKTFLENRVQSIKRRSGEQTSLSPDSLERAGSAGGLRRKKSMLSKQIDNDGGRGALGYKDGADQLERKKSLSSHQIPELKISDLKELDALVRDPSKAMQKLSLDTNLRRNSNGEMDESEDMPILPQAPGIGLRRSTRTTYRRGSLRKEGRGPRRAGTMRADTDGEESPIAASPIGFPLTKVHSEPTTTENFSRPSRGGRRLQNLSQTSSHTESQDNNTLDSGKFDFLSIDSPGPGQEEQQASSYQRNNTSRSDTPVPRIVETPPPAEESTHTPPKPALQFPERSSSQGPPPSQPQKQPSPEPPARSSRRPVLDRQMSSPNLVPKATSSQTLNEMAQNPSPLPGSNARTDSLTFIPTADDRKSDKKSKKDKDEPEGPRKTSWGWFKGSDEKDKKDKKKEEDHKESKKGKGKVAVDKAHDTARLDVLQATLDTGAPRGRESLLLERDNTDYKVNDEKKKESSRKSGTETKKEKDSLFSSLFGGGKKKNDRDSGGKKGSSLRTLSPEPPPRQLKPDIDYNWTRFSILEERAIYRMAHIKLANPRRALYSQVLLSNFMYSYLAKVQQMHPQMQIPQSALQKKQEADRKRKEAEEQRQQQQQQEGGEQYRYDYHQGITQYAEPTEEPTKPDGVEYVDDSQIYDYDHQDSSSSQRQHSNRPESRASQHTQENGYGDHSQYDPNGKDYYSFDRPDQRQQKKHDDDDDDDMW
ncbi:hypothetical protein VTL71DRAFT_14552 [Oculimacula yallundae]|uniref:Protein Zds1 C-terminal domain-containing protein n=1 Tax=Oculimacula yallundae TaxID=86028 RepID=A0ABR4CIT3_9HELO